MDELSKISKSIQNLSQVYVKDIEEKDEVLQKLISQGETHIDYLEASTETSVDTIHSLSEFINCLKTTKSFKDVKEKDVMKHIGGFTCLNDITARDLQKLDGQWVRAKSFDTFCAVGPRIVKDINPNNVKIQSFLNGKIKQDSNTNQFIFPVEKIVSFISQVMTLMPGDIIATGTPKGIGPMKKGDKIEIGIDEKKTLLASFITFLFPAIVFISVLVIFQKREDYINYIFI